MTSDLIWTLPAVDGTSGQVLQTNGAGVLGWVSGSSLSGVGDFKADGSIPMTGALELLSSTDATTPELTFNGDENTGIFQPAPDQIGFSTAGTQAMVINETGRVGIGTATPITNLHVQGNAYLSGRIYGDGAFDSYAYVHGAGVELAGNNRNILSGSKGANLTIAIGSALEQPTGRVTVHNQTSFAEAVGIGTTSPAGLLDVTNGAVGAVGHISTKVMANTTTADSYNVGAYSAGPVGKMIVTSEEGTHRQAMVFSDGNATSTVFGLSTSANSGSTWNPRFVVTQSGFVGLGTSTPDVALDVVGDIEYTGTLTDVSDQRLKEEIKPLESALDKVLALEGVSFVMKGDENKRVEIGVIAQQVEPIIPEVVHTAQNEQKTKSVNYIGFIGYLIEAIKELREYVFNTNATQDREIATLKEQNQQLLEMLKNQKEQMDKMEKTLENLALENKN